MAGIFGAAALGGNQVGLSIGSQVDVQLTAALITAAWAGFASFVLLKLIDTTVGLRVEEEHESSGSTSHCMTSGVTTSKHGGMKARARQSRPNRARPRSINPTP